MSTSSHTRCSIKQSIALAAGIAALVYGCTLRSVDKLTVIVSGDSLGHLEPCGCRHDQAGGLAGRARIVDSLMPDQRLVFDIGDTTSGTRPYEMLKLQYMLKGMAIIGYDAVNLGEKEAEIDLSKLREILGSSPLPFVSANVVAKSDHKPLTEPFRIVEREGTRFGVIGVTTCRAEDAGPGVEVRPVMETLAEVIPEVKPRCDTVVVLAFCDQDLIHKIADKYPQVGYIFGGDVPQSSGAAETINRASVFNVTNKGKVIGELDLTKGSSGFLVAGSCAIVIAADNVAAPPRVGELLTGFKNELRNRRYELASAEGLERISASEGTSNEFVGDKACVSCHSGAHKTWGHSAHANAFATLKKNNSEFDPDCLHCHTVGYALSTGFIDEQKTPNLANVQCESCHGRGQEHAKTKSKTSLKVVTPASCVKCHDQENSENFTYEKFWPKIAH